MGLSLHEFSFAKATAPYRPYYVTILRQLLGSEQLQYYSPNLWNTIQLGTFTLISGPFIIIVPFSRST